MSYPQSYRYGLISFSPDKQSYIVLGELYDKSIKENTEQLVQLFQELNYLYPFHLVDNLPNNIEDLRYFQNKYKITSRKIPSVTNYSVFHSPRLYELSAMVPLFPQCLPLHCYNSEDVSNRIAVIAPYKDPVLRGKLAELAIENKSKLFVVLGDEQGDNKVNTATLTTRFLLKCEVPITNIVKNIYGDFPDCLLDIIEILKVMGEEHTELNIFCSCYDLKMLQQNIKLWRARDLINQKIRYFCV